jgi:protein-export membrane protein SecD
MKNFKYFLAFLVCLLGVLFTLPTIMPGSIKILPGFIAEYKVNLGLDLRGGSQLLLSIDEEEYLASQYLIYQDEIRNAMRSKKLRFKDLAIKNDQSGSFLSFFSHEPQENILKVLNSIDGLDVTYNNSQATEETNDHPGGRSYYIKFSESKIERLEKNIMEQTIEIIRRRIDETGTKEPTIQSQGKLNILLQVPGLENPAELKQLLGKTAKLSFHLVNDDIIYNDQIVIPSEHFVASMESENYKQKLVLHKDQIVSGEMLVNASAGVREGKPEVDFVFDQVGTRKFGEYTKNNVGKRIAIVLDGKVISAPVVNSPILAGKGNISGNFTFKTASDLALLLRAGALPAPLNILEERTVGPSLGEASIKAGSLACVVGVLLVMLFMVVFYGLYGLFSCISLIFNLAFIIGLLSLIGANLTMAGIAGIVLTVGMAVDSNVLIFERIKEEMAKGITIKIAIIRGFDRAFATIFDSNLTTIIAAALLYIYGTGSVRGFAITLIIGIITHTVQSVFIVIEQRLFTVSSV